MANLTPTVIEVDGIDPAAVDAAAAAGGDEVAAAPGDVLYVANGGGGSIDVTVNVPVSRKGVAQYVVAVPAGATRLIALAPRNVHGHTAGLQKSTNTNDRAYWTYSGVTSVTVAVLRVQATKVKAA